MADRRLVAALTGVVALAGCAQLPSSGPVHRVARVSPVRSFAGDGVRVLAPPPRDAPPDVIAADFLIACADAQDDFAAARAFLTPAARRGWDPFARAIIYGHQPTVDVAATPDKDRRTVTVTLEEVATVGADGDYAPAPVTTPPLGLAMTATKVGGQWRLSQVPPGVLVSSDVAALALRPVDVYFFEPTMSQLVPDRLFLPDQRQVFPAEVLQALFRGPSQRLSGAVTSAIPPGVRLTRVATNGNALQVVLSGVPPQLAPRTKDAIVAQIAWTVDKLVPGRTVRVYAGTAPLLTGDPARSSADYPSVGPDTVPANFTGYYATPTGSLVQIGGQARPFAVGGSPLRHAAVSSDLDPVVFAGLACRPRCDELYVGPAGQLTLAYRAAGSLIAPSWDREIDAFWSIVNGPRGPTPLVVRPGGAGVAAELCRCGPLAAVRSVSALRFSRDGARVALIADVGQGPQVFVGKLVRAKSAVELTGFVAAAPALSGVVALSWADADHLVVLGQSTQPAAASAVAPYTVPLDGSEDPVPLIGTGLNAAPVSIAAGPDLSHSALVADAAGSVYQLNAPTWQRLGLGRDPSYPG